MMRRNFARDVFIYGAIVPLCAFAMLPLIWAGISALKPLEEVYVFPPSFSVRDPQWSNFYEAVTRLPILRFLVNSTLITVTSVMGAVLTSSMAGFALARLAFRGR